MNPFSFVDNPNDTDTFATLNNAGNVKAGITIGNANGLKLWNYGDGYFLVDTGNDPNNNSRFYLCVAEDETFERPPVLSTADTRSQGVKLWFFDYDLDGSLDNDANKVGQIKETDNKNSINGCNPGSDLKFLGWGAANEETNRSGLNDFTGLDDGDNSSNGYPHGNMIRALQGIVENTLDESGYPKITGGTSLQYLFDPEANTPDRLVYGGTSKDEGNVNYLFQNVNGYYNFNSNTSYAELNGNDFTVYDTILNQTNKDGSLHSDPRAVGFFPFDSYESVLSRKSARSNILYLNPDKDNKNQQPSFLNHHFGLAMETQFVIPENGVNEDGSPIIFDFSGDDDMWVYIDDQLVLDIGGLHQPVSGRIDFSSGYATITGDSRTPHQTDRDNTGDNAVVAYKNATNTRGGNYNFLEDLSSYMAQGDGKVHTMKIFYMERGGCDSNCRITFNMPLVPGKADLKVIKKSENPNETVLPGAEFGLWESTDFSKEPLRTGKTGNDGRMTIDMLPVYEEGQTYYLKETKAPSGYVRNDNYYAAKAEADGNGGYKFVIYEADETTPIETITQEPYTPVLRNKKTGNMEVNVEKKWMQGGEEVTAPKGAEIDVVLKRYKTKLKEITVEKTPATITCKSQTKGNINVTLPNQQLYSGQKIKVKWPHRKAEAGTCSINGIVHNAVSTSNSWWPPEILEYEFIIPDDGKVDIVFSDPNGNVYGDVANNGQVVQIEFVEDTLSANTYYVDDGIEEDSNFQIPSAGVYTLSEVNNWTLPSNISVPSADAEGYPYQYYFDEVAARNVPGGTTVTYEMNGSERKRITVYSSDKDDTITNNLPDSIELEVEKLWNENAEIADDASIDVTIKRYKLVNDETVTTKYGYLDIVHQFKGALTEMPEGFSATYIVKDANNNVVSGVTTAGKHRLETGSYTVTETITNPGSHDGLNVTESERTVQVTIVEEDTDKAVFESIYTRKQAHVKVIHYAYGREWQPILEGDIDQNSDVDVSIHRPDYNGVHIYSRIGSPTAESAELDYTPTGGNLAGGTNRTYSFHVPAVDEYVIYITHDNTSADEIWPVSMSQGISNDAMSINSFADGVNSLFNKGMSFLPKRTDNNLLKNQSSTGGYTSINGDTTLTSPNQAPSTDVPGKKYVVDENWSYSTTITGPSWKKTITQADMVSGQYLMENDSDGYKYLYFIESAAEHNMLPGTEGKIDLSGENVLTSTGERPLTLSNIGPVKNNRDIEINKSWINGDRSASSDEVTNYAVMFQVFQKELSTEPSSFVIQDDGTNEGWTSVGTYKVAATSENGEKVNGAYEAVFASWKATIKDLPESVVFATAANSKYYQYKVVEVRVEKDDVDVTSEFQPLPQGTVQNMTVLFTNDIYTTTSISGTKVWTDKRTHQNSEEITLSLERKLKIDPETSWATVIPQPLVTWEDDTYTFNNLPIYDNSKREYIYRVKETAVNVLDNGEAVQYRTTYSNNQDYALDDETITNTELTKAEAIKHWKTSDNMNFTPAAGTQIKLNLIRYKGETKDEGFNIEVIHDGVTDDNATEIADTNGVCGQKKDGWQYEWTKLEKYYDNAASGSAPDYRTYTYQIEETAISYDGGESWTAVKSGKTVDGLYSVTTNGLELFNQQTEISVTKVWHNQESGQIAWPESVRTIPLTLIRKKDGVKDETFGTAGSISIEMSKTGVVGALPNGVTATVVYESGENEKEGYALRITGLPKWYEDTNKEIHGYSYEFAEGIMPGWQTNYATEDGNTIINATSTHDGGQIINKPVDAVALPNTGGPGTRLFYLLGILLASIAGAGLLLRKHRSPG